MSENEVAGRTFDWISSVEADQRILSDLNERMARFYGEQAMRARYQEMLDAQEEASPEAGTPAAVLLKILCAPPPRRVLEVGCSSARLYRQLCKAGFTGEYTGVEVAEHIIGQNRKRHSGASWHCADAYGIPAEDDSFDSVFSFYVLEHLVWPARGLTEMMRVVRPGGQLLLVFPDFVQVGRFSSQLTGLSLGEFRVKLRRFRLLDAFVTAYDNRIRLPNALRKASGTLGSFPVNLRPLCLDHPDVMYPDVDAVYIASKREVFKWAQDRGYRPEFPVGVKAPFDRHSFIRIVK